MKEFNGFNFDEIEDRKRMKYVVIIEGDLDSNGAIAFKSKKELSEYLKSDWIVRDVMAVFKVEDLTP